MGNLKAVKLTNIVSAYVELPIGVHIIADKKYTVAEVETENWEGDKIMQNSIVLIEPSEVTV